MDDTICLASIYQLNSSDISIQSESFGVEVATDFYKLRDIVSLPSAIIQGIDKKEVIISEYAERLKQFSEICRGDFSDFHITHGDTGGNCILNGKQFFVIDWDFVKLTPIERDAWFFICNSNQLITINAVIQKHKLCYMLKQERLCYYCYYSFFYYLTEYLKSFLCAKGDKQKQSIAENLIEYLTQSWIYRCLDTADLFDGQI